MKRNNDVPSLGRIEMTGRLLDDGVSDWALRWKSRRLIHGVHAVGDAREPHGQPQWADGRWMHHWSVLTALQKVQPDAVGTFITAAVLHGMVLPRRLEKCSMVHVSTGSGGRQIRRPGVAARRTKLTDECTVHGVRLTAVSSTIKDLAQHLNHLEAVQLFDGLLGPWKGGPRLTYDALASIVGALPEGRKYAELRRALESARLGVQSPRETNLRLAIVRAGLPEPTVNPRIYLPSIGDYRKPDLAWEQYKVCCEYEGSYHWEDQVQFQRDIDRLHAFQAAGWIVIKVTRSTGLGQYLRLIVDALSSRGWHRPA